MYIVVHGVIESKDDRERLGSPTSQYSMSCRLGALLNVCTMSSTTSCTSVYMCTCIRSVQSYDQHVHVLAEVESIPQHIKNRGTLKEGSTLMFRRRGPELAAGPSRLLWFRPRERSRGVREEPSVQACICDPLELQPRVSLGAIVRGAGQGLWCAPRAPRLLGWRVRGKARR